MKQNLGTCRSFLPCFRRLIPANTGQFSLQYSVANMEAMYMLFTQKRWEESQLLRCDVGSLEETRDGASSVNRTNGKDSN